LAHRSDSLARASTQEKDRIANEVKAAGRYESNRKSSRGLWSLNRRPNIGIEKSAKGTKDEKVTKSIRKERNVSHV
jgi:hypothetical protein